jgi:hypothetical protein
MLMLTLAFVEPYSSTSDIDNPISSANSMTFFGVWLRAISISLHQIIIRVIITNKKKDGEKTKEN